MDSNNNGIFQFDLNAGGGNADSVIASRIPISGQAWSWGLQLGPDGKIYCASVLNAFNNYLSVINNPNSVGLNCNFTNSVIYLNEGLCSMGLPNYIDSYDYSNTTFDCSSGLEEQEKHKEISIYPVPSNGAIQIKSIGYEITQVKIYNAFGKMLYNKVTYKNEGTLNLNLANGIYFVHIICKEGTVVKKIIIQR